METTIETAATEWDAYKTDMATGRTRLSFANWAVATGRRDIVDPGDDMAIRLVIDDAVTVMATLYASNGDAIQHANILGGKAVLTDRPMVVSEEDADRMAAAGVEFAYLCDVRGQIVTVPVN